MTAETKSYPPAAPRWAEFPRPIVCLAPMDGYTDSPFRRVVRRVNPGVVLFSEFTSAEGFLRSGKVKQRLAFQADEQPYFVQLFGSDPAAFAEAARELEQQGVTGIDINMGCPAKKIVASQHGSGLMKDVAAAARIVERVAGACALQVSVKTRLGWSDASGLVPFARALTSAGASLVTIHGRTYNQAFHGQADWEPIYRLKEALPVPVIGNGDVACHADGLARLGNLDGFMIGRAAIGNPWVFDPAWREENPPSWAAKARLMEAHFQWMLEDRPLRRAVPEFRKHLAGYLKGFPMARRVKTELLTLTDPDDIFRRMEGLAQLDGPAERLAG
ncbi:MAG: tRNA-dihydrouridine synthase [Deltaproteobacteria bacterium]|nr:tRNA-dihydrouridine synthase [Deltaproteobacteria bacterium]